jgi:metal-responsive CopG/Arc/MetJ family transcriptional regulator
MQKIQILFPDPMMRKLREAAEAEDRPVSEVVRRAVEHALRQKARRPRPAKQFPTFHGGQIQVSADAMKQEIYADDE